MKSKISKLWGLGLIITLLASLVISVAPASAVEPLSWIEEKLPGSAPFFALSGGDEIYDLAIGPDGGTVYAATGEGTIYKSTTAGAMWTQVLTNAGTSVAVAIESDLIAVAADDSDVLAIAQANADNVTVYISTDGATSWESLGEPTDAIVATDISVSAAASGSHYIAVSGNTTAGGEVWYRKVGIGSWIKGSSKGGYPDDQTAALAVAFSPNFASDLVLTAVTENVSVGAVFSMFSVSASNPAWNNSSSFGENYPVTPEGWRWYP